MHATGSLQIGAATDVQSAVSGSLCESWRGSRCARTDFFCIATGPSLTREDCEKARATGTQIIVINDAYRLIPDADYLYACDDHWWKHHLEYVRESFKGKLYSQWHNDSTREFMESHGITALEGRPGSGLEGDYIVHGSNSGHQAMVLAYLLGARWIGMLGYDMQNTGGKTHFFGDHPKGIHNGPYDKYVGQYTKLAGDLVSKGVGVVNFTRETALTQFARADIDTHFHSVRRAV